MSDLPTVEKVIENDTFRTIMRSNLKDVPISKIESVIAAALSELSGETLEVTIRGIDFENGMTPEIHHRVKMTLVAERPLQLGNDLFGAREEAVR